MRAGCIVSVAEDSAHATSTIYVEDTGNGCEITLKTVVGSTAVHISANGMNAPDAADRFVAVLEAANRVVKAYSLDRYTLAKP